MTAPQGMTADDLLPAALHALYEVHDYRNAAAVLAAACRPELDQLIAALMSFRLTIADIRKPGGSESDISKNLSSLLRKDGWNETRIKGDLIITKLTGAAAKNVSEDDEEESGADTAAEVEAAADTGAGERIVRKNFLDGHKVDYVKNRVAFDLEWNSKDQTFDRDLYAFRAFHECDLIDAAVLVTRGRSMNDVFKKLGPELDADGKPRIDKKTGKPKMLRSKYGASTTWMGKLDYRLKAGRPGGCPVLALGITPHLIKDLDTL